MLCFYFYPSDNFYNILNVNICVSLLIKLWKINLIEYAAQKRLALK